MLRIYTLSNCDTCRRAVKWLRAHDVAFEEKAIRATPPSPAELRAGLSALGGNRAKLFNTAGADYRAQKLGEKLPALSDAAAISLLAGNGNLVKRPFAVGDGVALAGFNEEAWAAALLQK
jgi:arsenate reductase